MSFGRPPTFSTFSPTPPDRGSFPLDHDGECKAAMMAYLKCMKASKNDNGQCRHLSKAYLQCRMDSGLMEKDEMSNLGFHEEDTKPKDTPLPAKGSGSAGNQGQAERERATMARIV
ncbi:hypothetical protein FA10DRAFT_232551 [Acaromyces ingoldii]|uniref:Cytochrome c oxidase assembly protein COX19 n=1 Tax=Acaromyces ingoldii TaxID=215250 RepID=A0A316YHE1_9BASI|nr:hypothetical protein FA10DRAFT_232551 [Acaromyces ingoldii]PWN88264.1 hypothetical protein FA10DRAFT_232551 [Acaromyces ingoldii]